MKHAIRRYLAEVFSNFFVPSFNMVAIILDYKYFIIFGNLLTFHVAKRFFERTLAIKNCSISMNASSVQVLFDILEKRTTF